MSGQPGLSGGARRGAGRAPVLKFRNRQRQENDMGNYPGTLPDTAPAMAQVLREAIPFVAHWANDNESKIGLRMVERMSAALANDPAQVDWRAVAEQLARAIDGYDEAYKTADVLDALTAYRAAEAEGQATK